MYYPNNKIKPVPLYSNKDERFIVPFLLGGLAGGAAVGLTRPRPIYNVAPYPQYNPGMPYANYSYSYYMPYGYNNYPY